MNDFLVSSVHEKYVFSKVRHVIYETAATETTLSICCVEDMYLLVRCYLTAQLTSHTDVLVGTCKRSLFQVTEQRLHLSV